MHCLMSFVKCFGIVCSENNVNQIAVFAIRGEICINTTYVRLYVRIEYQKNDKEMEYVVNGSNVHNNMLILLHFESYFFFISSLMVYNWI